MKTGQHSGKATPKTKEDANQFTIPPGTWEGGKELQRRRNFWPVWQKGRKRSFENQVQNIKHHTSLVKDKAINICQYYDKDMWILEKSTKGVWQYQLQNFVYKLLLIQSKAISVGYIHWIIGKFGEIQQCDWITEVICITYYCWWMKPQEMFGKTVHKSY